MRSTTIIMMVAVLVGPAISYPDPNMANPEFEMRDENGYISIKDLGDLLSGMCGQLTTFKDTLAGPVTAGYGADILKTPLPLPNLGALDFLGIIKIVTQGLGMALDVVTKTISANEAGASADTAVVTPGPTGSTGFLITVGDIVDMAEYLCKVVNLVAAVLNNKLFDILHINRITIPLNDPRHPLPDLNWVDKLDILNLQGLGKGLYNVGSGLVTGIGCLFGCSTPTTEEPPAALPDEFKKPEKPAIFDDLSAYYDVKK